MKKSLILKIVLILFIASYVGLIRDVMYLKVERTRLINQVNIIEAKMESAKINDDRFYGYVETLGKNDMFMQNEINQIMCMIVDCSATAWSE